MRAIRPKLKDFHYGRAIFFVNVAPNPSNKVFTATIREGKCLTRPFDARIFHDEVSLFVKIEWPSAYGSYIGKNSLSDRGVVWHGGRNMHRGFTKRKQAEKYAARINAGCFSAAERKHIELSRQLGRCY